MAWPKWKKRLAWCLAIPAGLAVVGWVGMNVAESRLDAAIRSEESSLEAMGLHVKPLTPADDAAPLYQAALENRATMSTESFLEAIEGAARKPAYLTADTIASPLPGGSIYLVNNMTSVRGNQPFQPLSQLVDSYARQGRYDLAVRAQRCLDRLKEQVTVASTTGLAAAMFFGGYLYQVDSIPHDSNSRKELRAYFESLDEDRARRSEVSRAILTARRCLSEDPTAPTAMPASYVVTKTGRVPVTFAYTSKGYVAMTSKAAPRPWWEKYAVKHPLWHKMADLAVLRASRLLAAEWLKAPLTVHRTTIVDKLNSMPGFAASWAKSRQVNSWVLFDFSSVLETRRRAGLVALDLAGQVGKVKNPQPTWSKKWSLNPGTNKPVRSSIQGDKVVFNNKSWPSILIR